MLFASPSIGIQFAKLHPEVRRVLGELDAQLEAWNLAPVTLTCILRTPEDQERIYWASHLAECGTEEKARAKARAQFSWHLISRAADVRTVAYPDDDLDRIKAWVHEKCPHEDWEVLVHDMGLGKHLHLARRRTRKVPEPA